MYFEFLFRRAHSRSRVERMYWSGVSLNSFTTCSKEVTVGTTGPIGSGLPQLGFPRRFAIGLVIPLFRRCCGGGLFDSAARSHGRRMATRPHFPPFLFYRVSR